MCLELLEVWDRSKQNRLFSASVVNHWKELEEETVAVGQWRSYGAGGQAPPGAKVGGAKMSKTFKTFFKNF